MLRTEINVHPFLRTVQCCLCGSAWEEQYVSVSLLDGPERLGQMCPRCLQRDPSQAVARLNESVTRLRALARELVLLRQTAPGKPHDGPTEAFEKARLRDVTHALIRTTAHLRGLSKMYLRGGIDSLAEMQNRVEAAMSLAEGLSGMASWATTVPSVIEAERSAMGTRHFLSEKDMARAVDDRYHHFLAVSA